VARVVAPCGFSTLMTRAPSSASIMVQNGPARTRVRSMTRRPEKGPSAMHSLSAEASIGYAPFPRLAAIHSCRLYGSTATRHGEPANARVIRRGLPMIDLLNSWKESPAVPEDGCQPSRRAVQQVPVKNSELLRELRQLLPGKWVKVYRKRPGRLGGALLRACLGEGRLRKHKIKDNEITILFHSGGFAGRGQFLPRRNWSAVWPTGPCCVRRRSSSFLEELPAASESTRVEEDCDFIGP